MECLPAPNGLQTPHGVLSRCAFPLHPEGAGSIFKVFKKKGLMVKVHANKIKTERGKT